LEFAGKSLEIPVDFSENFKFAPNYFSVVKFAGKSLGIPTDFPESHKSAGNSSLKQNSQENL
jgi:hypothetical protein